MSLFFLCIDHFTHNEYYKLIITYLHCEILKTYKQNIINLSIAGITDMTVDIEGQG